jgi:hypothetical protein
VGVRRHCQSKFVYFAKTSEPDFAAIDFPAFFRVDLSSSMAAPSIYNFALTTPCGDACRPRGACLFSNAQEPVFGARPTQRAIVALALKIDEPGKHEQETN